MADGTLPRADAKRLRAAMGADARLRDAVERAIVLRRHLHRLGKHPVPSSQWRRLLRIPRDSRRAGTRRSPRILVAAAMGLAAAAALTLAVLLEPARAPLLPPPDERAAAVADFAVAMTYLRRSAAIADAEMRSGLRDALAVGRHAVRDEQPEPSNGD
jgi:hypothetical protein